MRLAIRIEFSNVEDKLLGKKPHPTLKCYKITEVAL